MRLTSHSLLKAEVMQIRKFLESCGIAAGRSRSNAPFVSAGAALLGHAQAIDELAVEVYAR